MKVAKVKLQFRDDYGLDQLTAGHLTKNTRSSKFENKWTCKERLSPGSIGHPLGKTNYYEELEGKDISGDVWRVSITTKIGISTRYHTTLRFVSEPDADAFIAKAKQAGGVGVFDYSYGLTSRTRGEGGYVTASSSQGIFLSKVSGTCLKILFLVDVLDSGGGFIAEHFDFADAGFQQDICAFERRFSVRCDFRERSAIVAWRYCRKNFHFTSIVYLAAFIHFSIVAKKDEFTTGYLFRELEMLLTETEGDALRGAKVLNGSRKSGDFSKALQKPKTDKVLAAMAEHNANQNVNRAARIVANKGIGTSAEANRKLWNRHNK